MKDRGTIVFWIEEQDSEPKRAQTVSSKLLLVVTGLDYVEKVIYIFNVLL